jgi:pyruvate/2-oxoglutarate dehydrogenase complex dihydrolipoamide acyltransferase (E2) component
MQAAMDLVKIRIEQAEINLARTRIEAPVDGVIVRDLVEEGAFVQRGAALAEFEDTSAVEVRCDLMSDEVAWLTRGHLSGGGYSLPNVPVQIVLTRGAKRFVWDGVLSRFDGVGLDENTRMFPCRILVEEPTGGRLLTTASVIDKEAQEAAPTLVRGMYVRVAISVPSDKRLADIPRKALQLGNVVWRVRDGKLSIQPANVKERLKESVVIELPDESQLAVGDRVVVSPMTTVVEGMQVDDVDRDVDRDDAAGDELAGQEVAAGELQAENSDRRSSEGESMQETAGASSEKDLINEKTDEAAANPSESDIDSGVST